MLRASESPISCSPCKIPEVQCNPWLKLRLLMNQMIKYIQVGDPMSIPLSPTYGKKLLRPLLLLPPSLLSSLSAPTKEHWPMPLAVALTKIYTTSARRKCTVTPDTRSVGGAKTAIRERSTCTQKPTAKDANYYHSIWLQEQRRDKERAEKRARTCNVDTKISLECPH